ncbi:MAG TPA: PLD nuclease N-terminal domain-containing protein [Thermoleophilia bacterium]|nr:PLD nuclease N-terminal domain-containing protein [Thermoleophilia bacterium]
MPLAATHADLSPGMLAVAVVFGLINLGLVAIALVSLVRRPNAGVRFHNKWVWGALIVLVNGIGPLAYLALGRVDVPLDDAVAAWTQRPAAERARAAVELLYGPAPVPAPAPAPATSQATTPAPAAAPSPPPTTATASDPSPDAPESGAGPESLS